MKRIPEEIRIEQINNLPNIKFIKWQKDYRGSESKAIVRCDADGFSWPAKVSHLINGGSGCPQCAGNRRFTASDYIEKINTIADGKFKFVCWPSGFLNAHSHATVRCSRDGFEWKAKINNLIHGNKGCPLCAGNRRFSENERVVQINTYGNGRFLFKGWVDSYTNCYSKASVSCCKCGNEWQSSIDNMLHGKGCPSCAKTGYDPSITGTLYAMRSDCGEHVKIGISNNIDRRLSELRRSTPFNFILVEKIDGDGSEIARLEKRFHSKYQRSGLFGFDGCTEWLVCTTELLDEIRNARDLLNQDV